MTTAPEQQTVHLDEQRFPCKYDGPRDYARTHVDGEGDIGLLVHCGETAASIYLNPEVAESLGNTLVQAAAQSRTAVQEIERVRQEEAEAARRLGEMEAARQAGQPYLAAGGSTSPVALPQPAFADVLTAPQPTFTATPPVPQQPPTFADVMLPANDTTAERERAFLRASELLGPDSGVASRIAMANYLLKGAA